MRTIAALGFTLLLVACDNSGTEATGAAPSASVAQTPASTGAPKGPATKIAEIPATTTNPQALAAFRAGVDALSNARENEAREQFEKALQLDPKFVSAMALLGASTPGAEGEKKIADAITQAGSLPEAERVYLDLTRAFAARDPKALDLGKKLASLVPDAPDAHLLYARAINEFGKREDAIAELKRATELDPTQGVAFNDLAYAELFSGKTDDAITHLKKFTELRPKEPNAQDSLGEAYLMAGKFEEAEAAFKRATEMDPKFVIALHGLGMTRLYKGDWNGGYEALSKLRDGATNYGEKSPAFDTMSWAELAQGKAAEAFKTIDAWDAEAAKAKDEGAVVGPALNRAAILIESGKPADGVKALSTLAEKIDKLHVPDTRKLNWRAFSRVLETTAYARLSKAPEAEKAAAATEELLAKTDSAELKGDLAYVRGEAALAKGDAKAAVDAFKGCFALSDFCSWERTKAEEKAGDKDAATASRDKMLKVRRRDPISFYVWSKLAPPAAAKP